MAGPIDDVYVDGSPVSKPSVRADDKTGHRRTMASVNDVRNADLTGQFGGIYISELKQFYDLDTGNLDPDDGDEVIIDVAGNHFVKLDLGSDGGGDVAGETHAATSKTTPVDADELPLVDSATSNVLKKLTWANLKAALAAWLVSAGWIREKLTANRTYYFATAANGGSDSNDGKTALTPFLTGQKAVDTVAALDISIYNVTIQAGDGTYTGAIRFPGAWVGTGTVTLQGNNTTPGNVIISTTSADAVSATNGAVVVVKDMELRTTTSGYGLRGQGGARISFQNIRFGACAQSHIRSEDGSIVTATGNYSIVGSASLYHWNGIGGGQIAVQNVTITLTGTPSFNTFANAGSLGGLRVNGNTFSGSATGVYYSASGNAIISVGGAGGTYLPGNSAGSTANGGQYF